MHLFPRILENDTSSMQHVREAAALFHASDFCSPIALPSNMTTNQVAKTLEEHKGVLTCNCTRHYPPSGLYSVCQHHKPKALSRAHRLHEGHAHCL